MVTLKIMDIQTMRLNEIVFAKGNVELWQGMKIQHATSQHMFRGLKDAIGIDPGRRWGMSFLQSGFLTTYWGTLPQMSSPDYHNWICCWLNGWFSPVWLADITVIEGAAYGALYSREMLEDVRLGFYDGMKELVNDVSYVPPLTIRKMVFGSAKIKGNQTWLDINENAADSVAMCLYAAGYQYKED
jgi:hypothetical protein